MSQIPPQMEGSGEGPNPLEIFWEKYRKPLMAVAVLLLLAAAARYGLQELNRIEKNKTWAAFTKTTGLNKPWAAKVDLQDVGAQMKQWQSQLWGMQLGTRQDELVTKLMQDVADTDKAELDRLIGESKDTPREPWLLWVAANRAYARTEWDEAERYLTTLKEGFQDHHCLCSRSAYPPQVRAEEEKEKGKDEDEEKKKKKDEKPKLKPAVAGSPVDFLLDAVKKHRQFRLDNPSFFKAREPKPDAPRALIKTSHGDILIGFYPEIAPKHVEAFLLNASAGDKPAGFYTGMHVHQIKRSRMDYPNPYAPQTMHLGLPESTNPDRSKWVKGESKEEDILDFEPADGADPSPLSFFPGMVAGEQEKDGKSSAKRFFINLNDCAASFDGDYVIFGRVLNPESMGVVDQIVTNTMTDQQEEQAGSGKPIDNIIIKSIEISNWTPPKRKEGPKEEDPKKPPAEKGKEEPGGAGGKEPPDKQKVEPKDAPAKKDAAKPGEAGKKKPPK